MSVIQAQPARTFTEVAHELGCHPSALTRWTLKGVLLKDGTRLKLEAIALPGSWRVNQDSLDRFLAALTADRTRNTPAESVPLRPVRSARSAQVHRELAEAGLI
jgi:hypothetical protein